MQISLFAKLIAFFCLALFATYMELVTTKVKKVIPLSNQLPTQEFFLCFIIPNCFINYTKYNLYHKEFYLALETKIIRV